ncbi:MAG: phage tail tape measure protein, partial [Burkholderiales bacterium]
AAPTGGSLLDPFAFGDEGRRRKLKANADKTIADLRETQSQIDNLRALRDQGAEKAATGPDLSGLLGDPKGAAKAAKAAGDQTKALIDASLSATKDALERERRVLEEALEDELISFRDYYAKRTAIAIEGINAEIAAKRVLLSSTAGEGEAARITSEIAILERQRQDVILSGRREQIAAEKELADQLLEVRARVFEAEGKTAEATRIRVEAEFAELTRRLEVEGDATGLAIVKRLFNIEAARGQLAQLEAEVERVRQQLARDESRINVEVETGLTGELAGRREIVRLHTQTAEKLRPIVEQMRIIAQTIGPEEVARVAELSTAVDQLDVVSNEVANSLNNEFKDAAASAFGDFIRETKTAQQAFADFGNSVLDAISRIVAQNLAEALFGNFFKTKKSGEGDILGGLTSLFGLFHEGGIAGLPGPSRRIPALAFAGAPRLHDGGVLGLRSNEVPAILQRGEEVLTRDDPRHRANRGEGAVNVVMNITTPDVQGFRQSRGQVMADVAIGLGRARRNLP